VAVAPPHATHDAPPVPQVALEVVVHVPFTSQQPLGHDAASHVQEYLLLADSAHSWPAAHAAHTALLPHEAFVFPALHVVPLQHPLHFVTSQVHELPEHDWVPAQVTHAAPPVPQLADDGVWHVPSRAQHPLGHDVAEQPHLPVSVLHDWPAGQMPHAAPAAPHMLVVSLA